MREPDDVPAGAVKPLRINPVYAGMAPTVFDAMSLRARALGAINLGQGFPEEEPPAALVAAAQRALAERSNQYPPGAGLPELRAAMAAWYAREQGLAVDPGDITVTSGATEAIAAAVLALVQAGDEVILFQPAYDAYAPLVRRAGGVPVSVPLAPPGFAYPLEALDGAIGPRTRLVMLNDPLNPAGTVAPEATLAGLARLCVARDLAVISDEVWEAVRFDGARHRSIMDFPGMAGRTVKIGSAGKIFGLTGWKIGWMIARGELWTAIARAHQFLTYASPAPLQWAVAEGLALPPEALAGQREGWARSRARLRAGLEDAGFVVLPNAATWFLCVDLAASGIALDDVAFAGRLLEDAGVATIPVSALYEGPDAPRHLVRLCFTKPDAALDEAVARMARWRGEHAVRR